MSLWLSQQSPELLLLVGAAFGALVSVATGYAIATAWPGRR